MFLLPTHCFLFFILLVISITCFIPFTYSSHDSEFEYETQVLLKLKQQWLTSPFLQTWNTSIPPCNNWSGILCSNNSITGISFPDENISARIPTVRGELFQLEKLTTLYLHKNQLSGSIPSCIANLSSLVKLDLSNNNLTGDMPKDVGNLKKLKYLYMGNNQLCWSILGNFLNLSSLNYLDLSSNNLKGSIPKYLGKLRNLEQLYLYNNQLSGPIPKSLADCYRLHVLRLDHNNLVGEVPLNLWILPNLSVCDLGYNKLSGNLPSKLSPALIYLDISNNIFSGPIQHDVSKWKNLVKFFASNNQLEGAIPLELTALPNLYYLQLGGNLLSGNLPSKVISWNSLTYLNFSRNNISGSLPIALGSLPNLRCLNLSHNKLSGRIPFGWGWILNTIDLSFNNLSGKIPSVFDNVEYNTSFLNNSNLCSNNKILNVPICFPSPHNIILITTIGGSIFMLIVCVTLLFKTFGHGKDNHSDEQLTWEMKAFHMVEFTEIEIVYSLMEDNVIGSGGSGKVYYIELNDAGYKVAVKKIMINKKSRDLLEKQFLAEVEILGRIRHANIVKLLCCISSEDSKLLVYEYLENESLYNWLHGSQQESSMPLDWPTRLHIAIGAAKGLSYMHHGCSPPIIHRDVKSSNILLDSEFNAKVADFGLAKISISRTGEPYTASAIVGTFGYMAPEYTSTRRLNEKIDVFSFGVVLLELCTGKEPRRVNEYMNLADWSQQHSREGHPIEDALDSQIKQEHRYLEEMKNMFKLGVMCTRLIPSARPSMRQVSELLISFNKS